MESLGLRSSSASDVTERAGRLFQCAPAFRDAAGIFLQQQTNSAGIVAFATVLDSGIYQPLLFAFRSNFFFLYCFFFNEENRWEAVPFRRTVARHSFFLSSLHPPVKDFTSFFLNHKWVRSAAWNDLTGLIRPSVRHGGRRGAHLQGGQVSSGTAGAVPVQLQLDALPVGRLQRHAEQQLGRGARAHVAHHPHHRGRLLGGVCGGISGQLSGDVRHRSVSLIRPDWIISPLLLVMMRFGVLFFSCAFMNLNKCFTWKTDFFSLSFLYLRGWLIDWMDARTDAFLLLFDPLQMRYDCFWHQPRCKRHVIYL